MKLILIIRKKANKLVVLLVRGGGGGGAVWMCVRMRRVVPLLIVDDCQNEQSLRLRLLLMLG
jgi:hypothetical protein